MFADPSTNSLQRRLIVCADDYGLGAGISRAIVALIERGRLSATSCMTVSPRWPEDAAALRPLQDRADLGLHLTLTELPPLGAMPDLAPHGRLPAIGELMRRAWTGRLAPQEIAAEVDRQLTAFAAELGRPPDFVDGHQHAHLLPVVRDIVLERLQALNARGTVYVRVCDEPALAVLRRGVAVPKALFLSALSRGLRRRVTAAGLPANDSFRGVTDFGSRERFGDEMRRFLEGPGERPLVMCHPGFADGEAVVPDAIAAQRPHEAAYLAGPRFLGDLAAAGCRIGRFRG